MKRVLILLVLGLGSAVWGADYYVATNGSDGASGAIGAPFATITHAVSQMGAGDTCFVRGGTYHEEVAFSGKNNLTFKAYPGEQVVMDGTVEIDTPWTVHSGNIYKTTLSQDIWQLFAGGDMMMPARWPNAFLHDDSVWDQSSHWAKLVWDSAEKSIMQDNPTAHSDLAALGFSVSNAVAVLNVGSFKTYARVVDSHAAGSDTFAVDSPVGSKKSSAYQFYFLEGKLELLDAEQEWFYDRDTNELYFWGDTNSTIRGKVQDYAFNVANSSGITISGIDFFATTVYFSGSSNARVEKGSFDYPSCTKRMLGEAGSAPAMTTFWGGSDNTFFDNEVRYAETPAVYMNNGTDNTIENCLFEYIDWSCADLPNLMGTVYIRGSGGSVFRGNTAYTTGASEFIDVNKALVADYNRISDIGLVQNDGSVIQLTIGAQPGSETAYNWFFDSEKYGARFDASTAVGSPTGTNGLMHHNVGFHVKSTIMQKGDFHECYNNTSFDCENNGIIILLDNVSTNNGTIVKNNAAEKLSSARSTYEPFYSGTIHSNNWNGYENGDADIRTLLRDPDNLDFRPKPGSVLVDGGSVVAGITDGFAGTAPDIGAYEHGDSNYWIPGRKLEGASIPVPPNAATNVQSNADLMWLMGLESESNAVYLGSNPGALVYQGSQTNNIFNPGGLVAGAEYFWRVDSVGAAGTVTGEVWSFTAEGSFITDNMVYTEHTNAPLENAVTSFLADSNVWNTITVANNDGVGTEKMYGQTFKAASDFHLAAVSFHATTDTKSYGAEQRLELALLEDTDADEVPDTQMGQVYSVAFSSIDGSRPWKQLKLEEPVFMEAGTAYGFVYTLIGPVSNNLRVANSKTGGYDDGKAINTDYTAGDFPNPVPPALNSSRDIAFTIQAVSAAEFYDAWASAYAIEGSAGYGENPDGDLLSNLSEYGLGGAPDDPNDPAEIFPVFSLEGSSLEYVYRRRSDAPARGLAYWLELNTNLVSGTWMTNGYTETGSADLGNGFETVTNQITAAETNTFIRLRISID